MIIQKLPLAAAVFVLLLLTGCQPALSEMPTAAASPSVIEASNEPPTQIVLAPAETILRVSPTFPVASFTPHLSSTPTPTQTDIPLPTAISTSHSVEISGTESVVVTPKPETKITSPSWEDVYHPFHWIDIHLRRYTNSFNELNICGINIWETLVVLFLDLMLIPFWVVVKIAQQLIPIQWIVVFGFFAFLSLSISLSPDLDDEAKGYGCGCLAYLCISVMGVLLFERYII